MNMNSFIVDLLLLFPELLISTFSLHSTQEEYRLEEAVLRAKGAHASLANEAGTASHRPGGCHWSPNL